MLLLLVDTSTDIIVGGKTFHLNMLHNPSHLEAVNPVSMGKARAKQLALADGPYDTSGTDRRSKVLNVQVHGDAAFPGQGINQECLMEKNKIINYAPLPACCRVS